jgi:hypothetical protein
MRRRPRTAETEMAAIVAPLRLDDEEEEEEEGSVGDGLVSSGVGEEEEPSPVVILLPAVVVAPVSRVSVSVASYTILTPNALIPPGLST